MARKRHPLDRFLERQLHRTPLPRLSRKLTGSGKASARQRGNRLKLLAAGYAIFVLIVCAVVATTRSSISDSNVAIDPFSLAQHSAVSFPLYYPDKLPGGYYVDQPRIGKPQKDIVVLTIAGEGGANFTITQQKVPDNYDFKAFYSSFGAADSFDTKAGTAHSGTIDGGRTRLASLITKDKTWILVTAPAAVPEKDIRFTLQHLTNGH